MKKQIRKSVFETNSSSSHTISISNPVDYPYLNWKLEEWSGKTLVYENNDYFNNEKLQGERCITSGTKFSLLLGLINAYIDSYGLPEKIYAQAENEGFDMINMPFYSWIKEMLKEKYNIDFVYTDWNEFENFGECYIDDSYGKTLWDFYKFVTNTEEDYSKENVIELFKDKDRFKDFIYNVVSNENVILVSNYDEW